MFSRGLEMKQIIKIVTVMILTTLAASASIVGSWQMEPEKTLQNNSKDDKFALGMAMMAFELLDIYDDHKVVSIKAGLDAKWQKDGSDYVMVDDSGRVPLKQLDNDHIMIVVTAFETPNLSIFYKRIEAREDIKLDSSITKLKLGSIYRSKKIKGDYRFVLIQKDKKFFIVQTDKTDSLTIEQIKGGDIKGSGSTFRDTARIYIKDGQMFNGSNNKQIEELSPTKLRYYDADYELQD